MDDLRFGKQDRLPCFAVLRSLPLHVSPFAKYGRHNIQTYTSRSVIKSKLLLLKVLGNSFVGRGATIEPEVSSIFS